MATFSRLFKPPPPPISPHPTVPDPTLKRQFRSDPPLLRLRAVEPFHAHQYGKKGGGGRGGGWSGGMERREGSLLVGGQGSAFSARKERGNWGERFQMFRRQKAHSHTLTHTHSTRLSVFMYSVQSWKDPGGKHVHESRYRFALKPHIEHSRALQILNNWFITHYNYIWGFTPAFKCGCSDRHTLTLDDEYNSIKKCHETGLCYSETYF